MPFQSTIARSLGKLLKTFKSTEFPNGYPEVVAETNYLTVPTAVYGPGRWDLNAQGYLTISVGATYDIGVEMEAGSGSLPVNVYMWGAGGSGGRGPANPGGTTPPTGVGQLGSAGGGGGYTTGSMSLVHGTTYKAVVGNARGGYTVGDLPWGDGTPSGNPISPPYNPGDRYFASGGYTGLFDTSVSAPNARLMAGGGGSGGYNDGGAQGAGGGGGGTNGTGAGSPQGRPAASPENGEGGTPTAGGAGGTSPHTNGSAGASLTGGQGGARGASGAAGGAGGSGWYGGGGGAGQISINTDGGGGGGGSAYIHPTLTGSTSAAAVRDAANDSHPYYVSGRAMGGVYDPSGAGWPVNIAGSPGTITFELGS